MSFATQKYPSPDGSAFVALKYEGEIRFGPPYFALQINGRNIAGRVFGDKVRWSEDSQYVALQEWLSTSESEGPQTSLICFQPRSWQQCKVSGARGGFIEPKKFDGDRLIYSKQQFSLGLQQTTEYEIEFKALPRWEAL